MLREDEKWADRVAVKIADLVEQEARVNADLCLGAGEVAVSRAMIIIRSRAIETRAGKACCPFFKA